VLSRRGAASAFFGASPLPERFPGQRLGSSPSGKSPPQRDILWEARGQPDDEIINHLTERGVMDPKLLYEAPFTDFDRNGVEGVFEKADVVRLVEILRGIEPRFAA
jgi:hypothetical protein